MTSHNVDLLIKPFNDGKNTLPVLKVDDEIFVYDKKGLYVFPVGSIPPTEETWISLGQAQLKTGDNVAVAAFSLYTWQFPKFDATTANPFQFIRALIGLFEDFVQELPSAFMNLEKQNWKFIKCDCRDILKPRRQYIPLSGSSNYPINQM